MATNVFDFSIDLEGDSTGERHKGDFQAKVRLSHRDHMQKDVLKRGLMGSDPQNASQDTLVRAEMFAHIQISLIKSPGWWQESGNGLDLFDDNVIVTVYERIVEEQTKVVKELKERGEKDREALRSEKKK